jgi:hypothetical protein
MDSPPKTNGVELLAKLRWVCFGRPTKPNAQKKAALTLFYVGACFADDPTEGDAALGANEALNQEPAFLWVLKNSADRASWHGCLTVGTRACGLTFFLDAPTHAWGAERFQRKVGLRCDRRHWVKKVQATAW